MARIRRAVARFDDSLVGKIVGVIALFGMLGMALCAPLLRHRCGPDRGRERDPGTEGHADADGRRGRGARSSASVPRRRCDAACGALRETGLRGRACALGGRRDGPGLGCLAARLCGGAASWTAWTAATAPVVLLGASDVSGGAFSQRGALTDSDQLVDSFDPANGVGFLGFFVLPFAYDAAAPAVASNPFAFSLTGAARTLGDYASKVAIQLERKLVFPPWPGTVIKSWTIGAGRTLSHFQIESISNDIFPAGPGYEYRLTAYVPQGCLPVRLADLSLHLRQEGR